MKWTKLGRTLKEGWNSFYRDGWLTVATVIVIALALYVLSMTTVLILALDLSTKSIKENVTLSVYFNFDVSQQEIIDIGKQIQSQGKVARVEYVSRDQALEDFKSAFADDQTLISTIEGLEKDEQNPLPASLILYPKDAFTHNEIDADVAAAPFKDKVLETNFAKNKNVIERTTALISFVTKTGYGIAVIFAVVAILITFNTVRMSMYTRRQEFDVMRLVGASNLYVRLPSIFEGIFYGLTGALIVILLLVVTAIGLSTVATDFFGSDAVGTFYKTYSALIILGVLVVGVVLGMISSFIAVRRYLER